MLKKIQYRYNQYKLLIKFRVDIIVALTAVFGYLIGSGGSVVWREIFYIFAGGFLVTATAHIVNQIIEKDLDSQMSRTDNRPLVTKSISIREAVWVLITMSVSGLFLLYRVHPLAAFISFVSLIMYAFIYTPMKQINRIAILIGAIPGALPILIGYVGATGYVDQLAILLFTFQVFWQFPHFWSIAWIWNDEYQKAGYDLMPTKGGRTKRNAFLTFLSTFVLFPLIFLFYQYQYIGPFVFSILLLMSVLFTVQAFRFFKDRNNKTAKKLMLSSVIYLPLIQIILILNFINL